MIVTDKETGATSEKEVTLKLDEGNRPKTTLADLQALQPVFKGGQRIKEGTLHHGRQRLAAIGRRRGARADGSEGSREARPQAAGRVSRHDGRRLRS